MIKPFHLKFSLKQLEYFDYALIYMRVKLGKFPKKGQLSKQELSAGTFEIRL